MGGVVAQDNRKVRGDATRARLLESATAAFAAKGFYGASLRDIGEPLSLANASLLHHFSGKSDIYAQVLMRIATSLETLADEAADAGGTVEALFDGFWEWLLRYPAEARIVVRELLDNVDRTARIDHWYLADALNRMTGFIEAGQEAGRYRRCDAYVFLFHLIGSISYFATGLPTIAGIAGETDDRLRDKYRDETRDHLLRAIQPDEENGDHT